MSDMAMQMAVRVLQMDPTSGSATAVLLSVDGSICLPIRIGLAEASSIAATQTQLPRPLAHDVIRDAVSALGGRVTYLEIHSVVDGVFHARITLEKDGQTSDVDSRASDAIALSIRVGLPVFVSDAVLEVAGVRTPSSTASGETRDAPAEHVSPEQLGPFRDVIESIDLNDD